MTTALKNHISGSTCTEMRIISGSVSSIQGRIGDHNGVGDHFGSCTDLFQGTHSLEPQTKLKKSSTFTSTET